MILKIYYHLPVRRPAPKTLVQPDDVIGGHRAGENNPQSQCDPSQRRAAVDKELEEPETPPRSPAVGMGPGSGVSRAETQMEEEEISPLETSMGGFFNFNATGAEQQCILLQSDVGVNDNKVQP